MTIEIHAPGGSVIEFPDGTDATTIQGVMHQHFGGRDSAQDKAPSMATGLTKAFAEGAPIVGGLLNKGDAAFDAVIAPYVNWMLPKNRQNTGKTFGERYQTSLDARERMDAAFERDHPYLKTAAEVAGGVASTGALAGTSMGAKALGLAGKTLPEMIGRGAVSGAAIGGADSAIRGGNPVEGAAFGGLAGAGGPIAGRVGGAVLDKLGRTVRAAITPEQEAAKQVAEAFQKDAGKGLSAPELDAAAARGQPVTLMDMGSRATQRLARRSANFSPEAQDTLENTLGSRYRTQNSRMGDWINTTFNFPDRVATQKAIEEVEKTVNRPAYAKAYAAGAKGVWDDNLEQMTQAPVVQEAIRMAMASAKNDAALRGFNAPKNPFAMDANGRIKLGEGADGKRLVPSLQFWDHVKRALDKVGSREAQQWSKILRDHLDPLFPDYAAARGGAAKFFGAEDALEAGRMAVQNTRMDNREIRDGMSKLSDVEKKLFRDGFTDEFVQSLRSLGDRTNILDKINSTPKARERLLMVVGPERSNEIEAYLRVEDQMQRANRKITGNSSTKEQGHDMNVGAMDLLDIKGAMLKILKGAASAAGRGIDERVAVKIAEMLTAGNHAQFSKAIKLIAKNKRLMSAIRNPDEAYTAAAGRGAVLGADADWQEDRSRQRGDVTVD